MNRIARGEHLTVPAEPLHAAVTWTAVPALPDAGALTVAALLLDARGTLRSDVDLVSSQHAGHPSGAVLHLGTSEGEAGLVAEWLVVDPALIEPDVTRIVVAAATKGRALGRVPGLGLAVTTAGGDPVAHVAVEDGVRFDDDGRGGAGSRGSDELGELPGPGPDAENAGDVGGTAVATATAAVFGEFRRQDDGGWRFAAVLRGYASGLGGVVEAHRAGAAGSPGDGTPADTGTYGNGVALGGGEAYAAGMTGDPLAPADHRFAAEAGGHAPGAEPAYRAEAGSYTPETDGPLSGPGVGIGTTALEGPDSRGPGAEPLYRADAGAYVPQADGPLPDAGPGIGTTVPDGLGDHVQGAEVAYRTDAGVHPPQADGPLSGAGAGVGATGPEGPGSRGRGAEPPYPTDAGAHAPQADGPLSGARPGIGATAPEAVGPPAGDGVLPTDGGSGHGRQGGGPGVLAYEGHGTAGPVPAPPARVPAMPSYAPDVPGAGAPAQGQGTAGQGAAGGVALGYEAEVAAGVPFEPVLRPPVPGAGPESPFGGAPGVERERPVADPPTVGLAVVVPPAREVPLAEERAVVGRVTNRPVSAEPGVGGPGAEAEAPVDGFPSDGRTDAGRTDDVQPLADPLLADGPAGAVRDRITPPASGGTPAAEAVPLTDLAPAAEAAEPASATAFAPWERTGNGDEDVVLEGPLPDGPVLVEFASPGGPAAVEAVEVLETADGEQRTASPLMAGTGRFRGRAVFAPRAGRAPRLRVTARRQWSLTFLPLAEARLLEPAGTLQGTGPDVLRYSGPAADLRVNHTGGRADRGSLTLRAVYPGGDPADRDGADLLAQGRGALIDVTPVAGPCLLLVDADGPWSLAALPDAVPEPEPADGVLAEYAGQGRNLEVVEIAHPCPGSPVILEYDLEGSDFFAVTEIDPYGDTRELISKDEGFQGRRLLFTGLTKGAEATRLELGALTRWRFRLRPLSAARPLTDEAPAGGVTGTGCDVLVHHGPPAALTLTTAEAGPVHVTSLEAGGLARVRVTRAHTPRPAHGPLRATPNVPSAPGTPGTPGAPGTPTYVLVTAAEDQSWKLTLRPPEEIRAFGPGVAGTGVEGHGHDVVRWTGAPGPVRFDYDFDDGEPLLDEIPRPELWALDEHLSPLYRVAAGIGVHHVPTGCLQVRAHRAWRLTADGSWQDSRQGSRQAPDAAAVEGWPGTS
ncbi:TerD family protein [Streptomyces huiliensis]|uniref:TerD family protein n=1 Tax=Streptomyces huiliensis TaxID=2876027 RepID=UPI001CBEB12F|nr:TerD family protein [Streptomyces huiliensis]MBZ4319696.1 TerD family protein [Streptomyces huiliensis]